MKLGIIRLYTGEAGNLGYYNLQELGLAKELVKNINIEVLIFILIKKDKYSQKKVIQISENIKIIYLPTQTLGNHGILNPIELINFNLDIIQLNADNQIGSYKIIKWALKNKIPLYNYIGTIESDTNNNLKKFFLNIILRRNYRIMNKVTNVAKTPSVYNELKNMKIVSCEVIPVGLDIENFKSLNMNSIKILKEKYNLPIDKYILVFVGRLEKYKKPLFILDLLEFIKRNDDKYHLLVVGNGSLKNEFTDIVYKKNLENNITHLEKIENKYMYKIYSMADVFINTNDKEIYGMSILEAMCQGCPVVAKEAPGPNFILENNINGYLIKNYDKQIWYEKIKEVIKNRESFSENCKNKIEKEFLWSAICDKYKNLFKRIME